MAKIAIKNYLSLGASTPLVATSYQIALDSEFTEIIDEIHQSEEYKLEWSSPLPKRDGSGEFYSDEVELHARIKLFLRDENDVLYASDDWYVLPVMSQPAYSKLHETITGEI